VSKKWFALHVWSIWLLLLSLCVSTVLLAWSSLNLIDFAAANLTLIRRYGLMGLVDGGLLQFLQISAQGILTLIFYLAFRGFENEIMYRWRMFGRS
jgi:hypothetical protein